MRICLLCGGVGGARAALALLENLPARQLTFVVNTGDDFQHLGLEIWPDWDTVVYTLAGVGDPARGWGRADEGTRVMQELRRLGSEDWFHLGDRDVALHLHRSWALQQGHPPARVAEQIAARFGLSCRVLRVTERSLETQFLLRDGRRMDFQTWFVRQQGQPEVARVECGHGGGVNPEVLSVIADCDLLLLAPSNPYLSVLPMLGVPEVARAVRARAGASWAVSPLLGGKAVKGPLDRLLQQLSPNHHGQQAIVELYSDWVQRLLLPADELKGLHSDRGLKLQPCRTRLSQARQRAEFVEDLMAAWKAAV